MPPGLRQASSEQNSDFQLVPELDTTIHSLFQRRAAATPDATALVFRERNVSYAELERAGNRVAHALLAQGIVRGQAIGLTIGRSPEMIAAMLGILKAGAAYVPMDPEEPAERLAFQVAEASIDLIVVTAERGTPGRTLGFEATLAYSAAAPDQIGDTNDPAYVMFTSGSTGQPKGVEIPHRGVVRLVSGDYCRFGSDRVFLHLSPPNFDASTFEIWGALLHGGCCVLYPDRLPTVSGLRQEISAHRVTTLWLTASLFNTVVDEAPSILSPVEELLTGGEALSVDHVRRAMNRLPDTQIINGYGPTECTTFACCYRIPREFGTQSADRLPLSVPIGKAIAYTQVYILDQDLRPVPAGMAGELCIGGAGLAIGYRNRPDITREKFITHPQTGILLYRSGDQARIGESGLLEFAGRLDHQVKIRGHRIELEEIEACLRREPAVREAAVVVRRLGLNERQQLIGFVAPRPGMTAEPLAIRESLKTRLPKYMVPNPIVALAELPRNRNGKVDRSALAARELPRHSVSESEMPAAGTVEARIAHQMAELLGIGDVGRSEDFLDLGGDSLSAVRLIAWLESVFQWKIRALHDLTPAALASAIATQSPGPQGMVLMKGGGDNLPVYIVNGIDGRAPFYPGLFRRLTAGPIFGLVLPEGVTTDSVEGIASHHVASLKRAYGGPYRLCGYSFGGILAFEIARQLAAAGDAVAALVLLDSSTFGLRVKWTWFEQLVHWKNRTSARIALLRQGDTAEGLIYLRSRAKAIFRLVRDRVPLYRQLLHRQIEEVVLPENLPLANRLEQVMLEYAPKPYDGDVVLIRAGKLYSGDTAFDSQNGWGKLVRGQLTVHLVSGNHLTMLSGDSVDEVGRLLNDLFSAR